MFKTNGSTHFEGIANEHQTIDLLNEHRVYADQVTHKGGTKNKADAVAGKINISIKHKKGLRNGSFDWVNTSQVEQLVNRNKFNQFKQWIAAKRSSGEDLTEQVDGVRIVFNILCNSVLNQISSADLTAWLKKVLIEDNEDFSMVINDTNANRCYVAPHHGIRSCVLLNDGFVAELVEGKGSTSRKVVLRKGEFVHDTGLRLRVTSNNGIKAFLGISKANKSSQVVLKLQQDKVQDLVNGAEGVQVIAY